MDDIECITLFGERRSFPRESLILRPAAYGLILHQSKILLMRMRYTGKYHTPGGGIHPGEMIQETLHRETREETGIEIEVERFVHFEEVFFYYDPSGKAYHGLHFYYACKPLTFKLLRDDQVEDGAAGQPRWVEVRSLRGEDFQQCGDMILNMCKGGV